MLPSISHPPRFSSHKPAGERADSKRGAADWNRMEVAEIPSSLDLDPAIAPYLHKENRILDLGCGFGKTVFGLFLLGYRNLVGVDSHAQAIESAKQQATAISELPKPEFIHASAQKLPFSAGTFDTVITQAFWTAIPDGERQEVMNEAVRVLKPGSPLYMADFQQTWDNPIYAARYQQGIAQGHKRGTFEVTKPSGEVEYLAHHFTQDEVSDLMQDAGLEAPEVMLSPQVKTRSGNLITGIIAIARKAVSDRPRQTMDSRKGIKESRQQLL